MISSALAAVVCLALCATIGAQRAAAQSNSSATPQQPGAITGHIYRADNNEPVPRAIVSLNPVGGRGVAVTASPQSTRTDITGTYTFTTVTPGNYILGAQHSGFINGFFMRTVN